jgi:hypothetical protein
MRLDIIDVERLTDPVTFGRHWCLSRTRGREFS